MGAGELLRWRGDGKEDGKGWHEPRSEREAQTAEQVRASWKRGAKSAGCKKVGSRPARAAPQTRWPAQTNAECDVSVKKYHSTAPPAQLANCPLSLPIPRTCSSWLTMRTVGLSLHERTVATTRRAVRYACGQRSSGAHGSLSVRSLVYVRPVRHWACFCSRVVSDSSKHCKGVAAALPAWAPSQTAAMGPPCAPWAAARPGQTCVPPCPAGARSRLLGTQWAAAAAAAAVAAAVGAVECLVGCPTARLTRPTCCQT